MGEYPWPQIEALLLSDLLEYSFFDRHPDVQRGNSSEHALILDFKRQVLAYFDFYSLNKMDAFQLKRFFEFYLGAWSNNDRFWMVLQRVWDIKCVSYQKLQEAREVGLKESMFSTSQASSVGNLFFGNRACCNLREDLISYLNKRGWYN